MAYPPISEYGVIGDMHSAALVSRHGSIDWLCLPRFDSPSVFAAILDDSKGGRWHIRPAAEYLSGQRYLEDTNVLCTEFRVVGGRGIVLDFMPLKRDLMDTPHEVVRIVRCEKGELDMTLTFEPRLDYARSETTFEVDGTSAVARCGDDQLALVGDVPLSKSDAGVSARFILKKGESTAFVLHWGDAAIQEVSHRDSDAKLDETCAFWRWVAQDWDYKGRWRSILRRSMLALHLLLYVPTGAVCAAATTSLPEEIGGMRNWDYRFTWLRDGAFTFDVLHRFRHTTYSRPFIDWLARVIDEENPEHELHSLYAIVPQEDGRQVQEHELTHFEGYRGSRPVRIGNAAYHQFQLDLYGEMLLAFHSYQRAGGEFDDDLWNLTRYLVETAARRWQEPDAGIWEFRTEPRHFTFSKLMAWVALDRGLKLARALGREVDTERWQATRADIRATIEREGWNEERQSFTQYLGGESLDASLLFLPMVGFLKRGDPRLDSTIDAIWSELGDGGLVRRYIPEHAGDGIEGGEGSFTMCTLWLSGALVAAGRLDEALALFEKIVCMGNHAGIYSEMFDPATGAYLGNYPQAFTHIALIHTARNLDRALTKRGE